MSASGTKRTFADAEHVRFRGKADIPIRLLQRLLMTQSGHSAGAVRFISLLMMLPRGVYD